MRPRKTNEEKKLRGTFKKTRASGELPTSVVIDVGEPIVDLSEKSKLLFNDICKIMSEYKFLAEIDIYLITMLCVEYDTYLETLGKDMTEITKGGVSVQSAYHKIRTASIKNIMDIFKSLNISPNLRIRINKAIEPKENPMDEFL